MKIWKRVASFTDAWIETSSVFTSNVPPAVSHLLQMRGLKLLKKKREAVTLVASFTDAWIETYEGKIVCSVCGGRIFYRCVD